MGHPQFLKSPNPSVEGGEYKGMLNPFALSLSKGVPPFPNLSLTRSGKEIQGVEKRLMNNPNDGR